MEKTIKTLRGVAWARHAHGMVCMNQTRPHCVKQMGKIQNKLLGAQYGHGMGTAWYV